MSTCTPKVERSPRQPLAGTGSTSLLPSARCRTPASPLPAFCRFMAEAGCSGAAPAGLQGDAGGSGVAGVGARCRLSSHRLAAVSRRAWVCEKQQDRELGHSDHARRGAGSRRFTGLARRSERGGGRRGLDMGTGGNPPTEGFRCREAAAMNLVCCF